MNLCDYYYDKNDDDSKIMFESRSIEQSKIEASQGCTDSLNFLWSEVQNKRFKKEEYYLVKSKYNEFRG